MYERFCMAGRSGCFAAAARAADDSIADNVAAECVDAQKTPAWVGGRTRIRGGTLIDLKFEIPDQKVEKFGGSRTLLFPKETPRHDRKNIPS